VVFSFRVSIPGVALAAENDTHCTASRSGSMFETKSDNGYVTNAPVPKIELVDCSQWDVDAQAWRNKSRGGHCEMTAFDCDSGRATCTCKHLTDFAALFKYNFKKLEKALKRPEVDVKNILIGILVVCAPIALYVEWSTQVSMIRVSVTHVKARSRGGVGGFNA
jgi:hypothetical protein